MSVKLPSKSVFVGNIPYGRLSPHCSYFLVLTNHSLGLTEEQITDIFSSAGKVLSFRLVYDRETGRPKGFGFAEYPDSGNFNQTVSSLYLNTRSWSNIRLKSDSAASAVRNLNDFEIMNRKLRVDFSNDGAEDEAVCSHT